MAQYKIDFIMSQWCRTIFEAPDGLSDKEAWEWMVAHGEHHHYEEAPWSYDKDWWNEQIEDSEASTIENLTEGVVLYEQP